jgi:hypothetical protein
MTKDDLGVGHLLHEQACGVRTDEEFNYLVKKYPLTSLNPLKPWVFDRLSSAQFDYCIKLCPITALDGAHINLRLNSYQRAWCNIQKTQIFVATQGISGMGHSND